MRLHSVDLAIVIAYLAGVTLLGIYFRGKQKSARDYFLGGKNAAWWALAFSIVATETSTLTIVGTPALAYGGNMAFLQLAMGYIVGRILISLIFLPGYFRGEFLTAYGVIEQRFGQKMRSVAALTFLVTRTLAEGVRVYAASLVVGVALGIPFHWAVVLVMALTILYTWEGGMRAVIWTDVAQFIVYLAGSLATLFVLLHKIPGGWGEALQVAASHGDKFQIFDFALSLSTKYTFWSGVIGGIFLTMASHGTDQTIVQRILAAKNLRDGRRALIASGFLVFLQFTVFLLIGVLLFVFAQHSPLLMPGDKTDRVLPTFLVREMPHGLAGLLLAAILAVAMSNASGSLNSLAASSIIDLRRFSGSEIESERAFLWSRRMTVFWGLLLVALGMIEWGSVLETGLTVASLPFGSLLGLFLLGTFDKKATAAGSLAGMFCGLASVLLVLTRTKVAFTWYVLVGACVTFAAGAIASRAFGDASWMKDTQPQ